jgi:hypothetical protein
VAQLVMTALDSTLLQCRVTAEPACCVPLTRRE